MSKLTEKEIRKVEGSGLDVVVIGSEGKLEYATEMNKDSNYCDSCDYLRFESSPDPFDWFESDEERAICTRLDAQIAGALEPHEMTDIYKPLWCPKIGRELPSEEKVEAERRLALDKKMRKAPR